MHATAPQCTDIAHASCLRSGETIGMRRRDHDDVAIRDDWPQQEFLAWLDAIKKGLGLRSDNQLAARLGIGHTLISGWRHGHQRPSMGACKKIADALGEDHRRLLVLAGLADAIEMGLLDDVMPVVPRTIPEEIERLIDLYNDERLSDKGRGLLLTHVDICRMGIEASLVRYNMHRPSRTG
jgi:transcriptional regulator with XRE-family HTH domain